MNNRIAVIALPGLIGSLSGCGGGGSSPITTFTPPPVISFSHTFPAGGTFSTQGTPWNIVGVTTTLSGVNPGANGNSYDTLRVDVTFAQDISSALPPPGGSIQPTVSGGDQLGLSVGFDSDANRSTGNFSFCEKALTEAPYEFETVATTRLADGNFAILGSGGFAIYSGPSNPSEEATTMVSGNVLSETFQLGTIHVNAGSSIPHVGVAVDAFNGYGGTDCLPSATLEIFTDQQQIGS